MNWHYIVGTLRYRGEIEVNDFGGGGGKRGFGLWYQRGSTGTTYGEEGTNEFLRFNVLVLKWTFVLHTFWKGKE